MAHQANLSRTEIPAHALGGPGSRNKRRQGCAELGALTPRWRGRNVTYLLWKTVWQLTNMLNRVPTWYSNSTPR